MAPEKQPHVEIVVGGRGNTNGRARRGVVDWSCAMARFIQSLESKVRRPGREID